MSNPWLRLYTETIDDEKLRLLAFEDCWHFIALLCCKGKGIIDEANKDLMRRKVAVKLGLDPSTLDEVARRLAEVELIDAQTLQPLAWEKRQFTSDQDPTRAERLRKFRERKKQKGNASETDAKRTRNAHQKTDTDTDTDTEAETEVSQKRKETRVRAKSAPTPKTSLPSDLSITPELQAWANEHGYHDLERHLDRFKDKARAKGYQYSDWGAAFRNAIRDDWAGLRTPSAPKTSRPGATASDPRITEVEAILAGIRRPVLEGEFHVA